MEVTVTTNDLKSKLDRKQVTVVETLAQNATEKAISREL